MKDTFLLLHQAVFKWRCPNYQISGFEVFELQQLTSNPIPTPKP